MLIRIDGNHIITSSIEHPAILESCKMLEKEGFKISHIPVNSQGFINLDILKKEITKQTILISIMFANNEIGTIQPIKEIGLIAKENNVLFHTDAVQAVGAVPIDTKDLNIDALSLSAHKFYGPKGIGALYMNKKINFSSLISGGHQEFGKRAGTENAASILGMALALENAYSELNKNNLYIKDLRDYLWENIRKNFSHAKLNGSMSNRLPGNLNISFPNIDRKRLLDELNKLGICASAGSACSAGILKQSHVLEAIGMPREYSNNSLRITLSKYNTKAEVEYLIASLKNVLKKLYNEI